jgi:hypothetical protein
VQEAPETVLPVALPVVGELLLGGVSAAPLGRFAQHLLMLDACQVTVG